jgi:hypothetical protein
MPIYKNWRDFDAMRDKSKILVIYGAGYNGCRFLNVHKVIPNYFCDKNAGKIKSINVMEGGKEIPVLTLKALLVELNGRDADILVSNFDEKVIKSLQGVFSKTKLTENTVIYFRNNDPMLQRFDSAMLKSFGNTDFLLKNAYFEDSFLSIDEYEKFIQNKTKFIETELGSGRLRCFINRVLPRKLKISNKRIIYLFCDSRFVDYYCKTEHGIEFMLSSLLNQDKNVNYSIENYSCGGFLGERVIFQLTNAPLIKNSIVIINSINKPHLLAVAKRYCREYNCRLIYYFIPGILSRNTFTDYEKWYIKRYFLDKSDYTPNISLKILAQEMNIEFYEPLNKFFDSDKTIYLDSTHFGNYGNEIIAQHLHDIITNKIKPDNSSDDFYIELKEKIKYACNFIHFLVPDIKNYLADLKNRKRNFENCGAIVMNCNPFTSGHRYLIEYAAGKAEHLYIFVVEEDKSEFPFADRYKLVKKNTSDLKNVTVLPSGKFIISSVTFASYFGKSDVSEELAAEQDVSLDLLIFAAAIAPELNIKTRFVGQEPFDPVTRHYNEEMKKTLPEYGCEVVEIPRLEENGSAVSASRVRKLLKERNFEEIKKIVPPATLRYLRIHTRDP